MSCYIWCIESYHLSKRYLSLKFISEQDPWIKIIFCNIFFIGEMHALKWYRCMYSEGCLNQLAGWIGRSTDFIYVELLNIVYIKIFTISLAILRGNCLIFLIKFRQLRYNLKFWYKKSQSVDNKISPQSNVSKTCL